jgi:DNA-binding transcriptional LysR family regulator
MELEARLRAFAALARQGTFSAAAAELSISQPAISKHVAALEAELQVALVERVGRGSRLTPAGRFVAPYVLRAESLLAQAERGVAPFTAGGAVSLRIAASGTPGTYLLPETVARFDAEMPATQLVLEAGTSADVAEQVRSHRVELGVVGGFAAAAELDAEPLLDDDIVIIATPSIALDRPSARRLSAMTWITREEGSATRATLEAAWSDRGIVPRRVVELPSWEAVKLAAASGGGVAAISRLAIRVELVAGTLAIVELPRWSVRRTISLLTPTGVPLSAPAERFAAILRDVCAAR